MWACEYDLLSRTTLKFLKGLSGGLASPRRLSARLESEPSHGLVAALVDDRPRELAVDIFYNLYTFWTYSRQCKYSMVI